MIVEFELRYRIRGKEEKRSVAFRINLKEGLDCIAVLNNAFATCLKDINRMVKNDALGIS